MGIWNYYGVLWVFLDGGHSIAPKTTSANAERQSVTAKRESRKHQSTYRLG